MTRLLSSALAAATGLVACGHSTVPGSAAATSATPSASGADAARPPVASDLEAGATGSGCGKPPPQTGDFHLHATDGTGTSRDYEIVVPAPYDPKTPLALTFVYHGAGGTEAAAKSFGLQNAAGAPNASIFVFPQGIPYQTFGVGWDDHCAGYDMVFFDKMFSYLTANYCIDPNRVFAAGFSWGCDYVTALTCCRGSRIRAVAPASCSDDFSSAADYKTYLNEPCPGAATTAIRFTFDPKGDVGYTAQYFATTSALYQSFNSCSAASTPTSVSPCVSFAGCSKPLIECAYPGLGHTLPPNWASDTWNFFSTFR